MTTEQLIKGLYDMFVACPNDKDHADRIAAKLRAADEQAERQKKDIRALSNALGVALDGGYDNDDLFNMLQVLRSINAGKGGRTNDNG